MGNSASQKKTIVLTGLDHAGKTTVLYTLRLGEIPEPFKPTNGFNYEVVPHMFGSQRFDFHIWDLSGKAELRSLWKHFYRSLQPNVLVFVIDAYDRKRLGEAANLFRRLVHEPELHNSLKVVLLNVKGPEALGGQRAQSRLRRDEVVSEMDLSREVMVVEVNARAPDKLHNTVTSICKRLV